MRRNRENINSKVFFELLRAGLWEKEAQLLPYKKVSFTAVFQYAQEQSVVGLLTAGLEHVHDVIIPKEEALIFVGETLQLECRNKTMNQFLVSLYKKLEDNGISSILVKGQGVAQYYERPLWRACGDVDLLLDDDNYNRAKQLLIPLATSIEGEDMQVLHLGMTLHSQVIELHGSLRSCCLPKMDKKLDDVQRETIEKNCVRVWLNEGYKIPLPSPDNDVCFVFTHIIKHFFKEGVGLKQLCDWCRLLWTYKDSLDHELLRFRLFEMGVETEWKAFASLAVDYLGMPTAAMPFYSDKKRWSRKARRILCIILKNGSFGHNRDISYYCKYPFLVRKSISFWRHTVDSVKQFSIFPMDSLRAWCLMVRYGIGNMIDVKKLV